MGLVELVDAEHPDPEVEATFESGRAQYGFVLANWRAIALRPSILNAYVPYFRAVQGPGTVEGRTKDLVALQVAILNHDRYSVSHRLSAGRASGVTADDLDALAHGTDEHFDPDVRAALELARELTLRPAEVTHAENPQIVDAALIDRLHAAYTDPQIIELAACASFWNAITRLHRLLGLDLDMPAPPEAIDARL